MKIQTICAAITCVFALATTAQANVVNSANVGTLTTFQDTNTGRVWLDMNNFFDSAANNGTTGFDMIATATANGFTFATSADVHELLDSLPLTGGEWSSYAAVMGYGQPRSLIWGMYNDGTSPNFNWAWSFSYDQQWNFAGYTNANGVQNAGSPGAVDMGIWAYKAGVVPEPETYAMMALGLGLVAFAARRRKSA